MLNKCTTWFTCTTDHIFLGHCAVSPLFGGAALAIREFADAMAVEGFAALGNYTGLPDRFHEGFGRLLKTDPANISYVTNTATAMSMIAHGYPFAPGDQVISYQHEYPSNHYPWLLQQQRGVEIVLLDDAGTGRGPASLCGWSMEELERRVTSRTRVVAISHVQFASGFAADLADLGAYCKARNIDLIVDCAQSLGCLPVYPELQHIAGLAASGWKWLMGPLGSGVMYTSPELRQKLRPVLTGPEMMRQGYDYLDHRWNPHDDGRRFEYSTAAIDHMAALQAVVSELMLVNSMEDVRDEVFRLQDLFISHLDPDLVAPLLLSENNRSGIVMLRVRGSVKSLMAALREQGVTMTGPTGVLRLAPHFYMEEKQMVRAAEILNHLLAR